MVVLWGCVFQWLNSDGESTLTVSLLIYFFFFSTYTQKEVFQCEEKISKDQQKLKFFRVVNCDETQAIVSRTKKLFREKDAKNTKREGEEGRKGEINTLSETQKGISTVSCFSFPPPTHRPLSSLHSVWLFMVEGLKILRNTERVLKAEFMAL